MMSCTTTKDQRTPWHSRRIFSMRAFVAFAGVVMCAQSALAIYSKSVLTSIERRFGISSSMAGFIVGSFNIGNLLFVVAVSKIGSTGHRPRIMAIGSLLIALGGFVNFLPHLVKAPYQIRNSSKVELDMESQDEATSSYPYLFVVLIFGEILQGIGATVHIPLSSSYIDDFASNENSPVYLGISFVLQNIGPGFGYLIGSWTSTMYVDFDRVSADEIGISKEDKGKWIGAWWLGYIIISCWVIAAAIPLFFFPKSMLKRKPKACHELNHLNEKGIVRDLHLQEKMLTLSKGNFLSNDHAINGSVTAHDEEITTKKVNFCEDFWLTVKRLVTNLIYMCVVFGYSGLMFVVGALTAFMPKFLEVAYNKSPGSANLIFGLAVPPTMCIGLLTGGILVRKLHHGRKKILKAVIASGLVSLIPISGTFLLKCGETNQVCANVTTGVNGSVISRRVVSSAEVLCEDTQCQTLSVLFVVLTALGAMLAANMVTPIYTAVLRSVDQQDKCTAIGVMFLIIRVLGLVPAPVIAGAVIDETCLEWNQVNGVNKNCLKYNEDQFRVRYLILIFLGLVCCIFFNAIAYILVRRKEKSNERSRTSNRVSSALNWIFKLFCDSGTSGGRRQSAP